MGTEPNTVAGYEVPEYVRKTAAKSFLRPETVRPLQSCAAVELSRIVPHASNGCFDPSRFKVTARVRSNRGSPVCLFGEINAAHGGDQQSSEGLRNLDCESDGTVGFLFEFR